ncbi:hypothetical protein DUNSADRAFT_6765 [Dunaliella salina]|nr:hypothetical protein DUNSADRAFT_6765 [Dunaliella salina]|eukprot:KAF5842521.1 hypothetical protein DUNSADRAFT_6765 [Dunaliella salina]
MDSWSFVTIASHSSNSNSRSCSNSSVCTPSGRITNRTAPQASSAANPHVLLAGSVSASHCSRCWDAYLPWLCSHKQHAALAALCVCDTRHPGYVAERFALQHRSLYPQLATARAHYVFTSHADCPLCVWDLRRMSIPVFASNSRNLDHQTEGPLGRAANPAPNQAMLLDASEDLLLGRALNGTMWLWDLAELLGWQDSSGGLGVWEALEYLSPWESHSLPPKAWPVCLGALPPGANYLPVTCLLDASNPTSILLVTDPRNHDHASEGEGAEDADDEEALEIARQQQQLLEMGDNDLSRAATKEGESMKQEQAVLHGRSHLEGASCAGQAGASQAHAGAHIDGSRESRGVRKGWEGFGSWYSGEYGIGLDCWNCGARGHFMRDCPVLAAASVGVRGEQGGWRKGGWKYAVASEEHCGAGEGECGAAPEGDIGVASEGERGVQDEGGRPRDTLWGEHCEGGGASRGVEVCVDKGVKWVGGDADAWVDGAGDACDKSNACQDMDGNHGSMCGKGGTEDVAGWNQQEQHLQQQPQPLSGAAEISEGAAPVLSAGGIGEQLVRISFCRRE